MTVRRQQEGVVGIFGQPESKASSSGEPAAKKSRASQEDSESDEPPFEELDKEERDALRAWLDEKKAELHEKRDMASVHFTSHFRGSSWTASRKGVGYDCAVAEAQTPEAAEWAKKKVGNKMASFSVKKYGEDVAGALSCLWSDRMEFFYACHLDGRLVDGALTPDLRTEAPQPTLCQGILATKGAKHPGHARLLDVLAAEPRG